MTDFDTFYRSAAAVPLLTADDEQLLARRIEAGRRAAALLGEAASSSAERARAVASLTRLSRLDIPLSREFDEILRQIVKEGERARERFVMANVRLVHRITQRYTRPNTGLDFEDAFSHGIQGSMHALDLFDWRKGFKFSTYATHWIQQHIERALDNESGTVRVPVHVLELVQHARTVRARLLQESGREPSDDEVAAAITTPSFREDLAKGGGRKLRSLIDLANRARGLDSLDRPVGENGARTLGELVADETPDQLEPVLDRVVVTKLLNTLSARERDVVVRRFGLDGGGGATMQEVGREMGMTRARAHQIEQRALEAMRCAYEGRERSSRPMVSRAEYHQQQRVRASTGLPEGLVLAFERRRLQAISA